MTIRIECCHIEINSTTFAVENEETTFSNDEEQRVVFACAPVESQLGI